MDVHITQGVPKLIFNYLHDKVSHRPPQADLIDIGLVALGFPFQENIKINIDKYVSQSYIKIIIKS